MTGIKHRLEHYFEFAALQTNWRTEILAGCTTFLTMAYIVFVNPSILAEAGMPHAAVIAATCFSAAAGSLLMGGFARYPIALAPGMGLNAYFTYTVVKGMGVAWPTALGAVFCSGIAFLALTFLGIRQMIVAAVPSELYAAISSGIGLFIALIGFRNSGIIVSDAATTVHLGDLSAPGTLLSLFGLLLIAVLLSWKVRAAMLIGVVATTLLGVATGHVSWRPLTFRWSDISATAFHFDVSSALQLGFLEIVFVFLFVDLFDNLGTLAAVGKKANLFDKENRIPRLGRILLCDAAATTIGAAAGTSTVVSYIESAAGVAVGGRSGVTAIVTGLLFVAALFFAPLAGIIPPEATAPALIIVGSMMITAVSEIRWEDPVIAISAFLMMLTIPLAFSIADGLAFGFCAYTILRVFRGQMRRMHWLLYLLTAFFLLRFYYLSRLH